MSNVELQTDPFRLVVDGHEIRSVKALCLTMRYKGLTTLELELAATTANFKVDDVIVSMGVEAEAVARFVENLSVSELEHEALSNLGMGDSVIPLVLKAVAERIRSDGP
jgi:fructose-1-phosphate kinase PfkB-like protein